MGLCLLYFQDWFRGECFDKAKEPLSATLSARSASPTVLPICHCDLPDPPQYAKVKGVSLLFDRDCEHSYVDPQPQAKP